MSCVLEAPDRDGVALLRLDDGKANSLTPAFITRIDAALDAASQDARALVVAGRVGFFCAGLDLGALTGLDPGARADFVASFGALLARLRVFALPVVAIIGGHAVAGGALLALCADARVVVAGPWRFAIEALAKGIPLPAFALEIARAALPGAIFRSMVLGARPFSPAMLCEHGLALGADDEGRAMTLAHTLALQAAMLPRAAFAVTKARLFERSLADALARSRDHASSVVVPPMSTG